MQIEKLERDIMRLLQETPRVDEGELLPLVEACCDTDEEREALDEEGLEEVLSGFIASRCLLSFNWISWGAPTSSSGSLWVSTMTKNHFVWLPHDLEDVHPLVIVAAVPISEGAKAISDTVETCLAGLFDWEIMGRPPTETSNEAPDLLSEQAVKNAYRSAAQDSDVWNELLGDLADLTSGDLETTQELTDARSPDGEARVDIDSEVGTRLFETWFSLTYSERPELRDPSP